MDVDLLPGARKLQESRDSVIFPLFPQTENAVQHTAGVLIVAELVACTRHYSQCLVRISWTHLILAIHPLIYLYTKPPYGRHRGRDWGSTIGTRLISDPRRGQVPNHGGVDTELRDTRNCGGQC